MSDTIYREDAINALEKLSACEEYGIEVGTDEETYIGKYEAVTAISDLPSADRPQGEWELSAFQNEADVANGNYAFICSNCEHTDIHALTQRVPYCWWCGARMKGADDES